MNAQTVLEQDAVRRSAIDEVPESAPSFSTLVAEHTIELPGTDWLTRLPLDAPRENVHCLPVSLRIAKRCVDILGSITLLVVTSPIMLLAAIGVKLTSPGSVIYSQTRVGVNLRKKKKIDRRSQSHSLVADMSDRRRHGRDRREMSNFGRPFTIYKFRTMRNDAERNGVQFASQGDARITPIGRLMRRTRIDELPQLWNILKGDMSLIGPRPEQIGRAHV